MTIIDARGGLAVRLKTQCPTVLYDALDEALAALSAAGPIADIMNSGFRVRLDLPYPQYAMYLGTLPTNDIWMYFEYENNEALADTFRVGP
jgi:hypothetical protein